MFDMHYDLLSICYYCYLKNDYSFLLKISDYFNDNNIKGVIANLYFMNKEEMFDEIGNEACNIDVIKMFYISTKIFKQYFPNTEAIFSIEGCDYIKDINELEILYQLGLRNILLTWNNQNKYGSGIRYNSGLTELGKIFLIKAIDLGICIDISHMSKATFYDTINLLNNQKKLGKKIKVISSHSNCNSIYEHVRNLDDKQILCLKNLDAVIGAVSYSKFVINDDAMLTNKYLEHIDNLVSLIGIDNVGLSTDDMTFSKYFFNKKYGKQLFSYATIKKDLISLLNKNYNHEEIEKILYKNIKNKLG